jgi:aryl-alcohol dehydrogenase-like predicted oxidoreductase
MGALADAPLKLTALGLGTAALATRYGAPGAELDAPDREEAIATIELALSSGVRFIDTAPAYGDAEALVGTVCAGGGCTIATKLASPPRSWEVLSDRELDDHVRRSVGRSLQALRATRIDLLQIHNADAATIADGRLPALLEQLRSERAVLACGATVYGVDNALAALECSALDAVQVPFSALDRRAEQQLAPVAAERGKALIARSVLLRGVLSSAGNDLNGPFAPLRNAADRFRRAMGASWEELPGAAVAFVGARRGIACALLGPREPAELEGLLDGARRFAGVAAEITGDWDMDLADELVDPSRWPEPA